MNIAILGTGIVGRTIADKLLSLGHVVTIGTRDVATTLNRESKDGYGSAPFKSWYKESDRLSLRTFEEAASQADLLFNCTAGQASIAVLESIGEEVLADKILIDIANPLDFTNGMPPTLSPVNTDSLGEQIQARFPRLRVVKSLNTMNTNLMVSPTTLRGEHNVFVCGNDEEAKNTTKDVLRSFGWNNSQIIDLGDISNSRGTEMLLPIWIRLWGTLGTAEFNFHIQKNQ